MHAEWPLARHYETKGRWTQPSLAIFVGLGIKVDCGNLLKKECVLVVLFGDALIYFDVVINRK